METSSTLHPKCPNHLVSFLAVLSLLVVQDFLYTSSNYHWFEFNRHKGWTSLTALGVAFIWPLLLLALSWLGNRFGRPIQFGIGTLMALMFVAALPCLWVAQEIRDARSQADLVRRIRLQGGDVLYVRWSDDTARESLEDSERGLLAAMLGRDFFSEIGSVRLESESLMDEVFYLDHVQSFKVNIVEVSEENVSGGCGSYTCTLTVDDAKEISSADEYAPVSLNPAE